MVGTIKAGLILVLLCCIVFTAEARVMRAGPGDGLDFQTNGVNSRAEIKSDGTFQVKDRLEVETTGQLSRPYTSLTEVERDGLTPAAGDVTYNETSGFLNFFNTVWRVLIDSDSSQTLTNKTLDANSNSFSNFEHGAEVDNPSSGVHGVTGNIVGTTDTQDLSNKTFTDAITVEELGATPSTPAAGDKKLYCKTDDKCYQLNDAGVEVELGAGAGGAGGDVNNLLTDGGFDTDATSGVDGLTCTVGTCSQETTNQYIGDGALKVSLTAQSADVVKIYDNTNSQWDNRLIQIEARVKTSATSARLCSWDGVSTGNCINIASDDTWAKYKIIENVGTENTIGWKLESDSETDDIFIDATSIWELQVDTSSVITNMANCPPGFSDNWGANATTTCKYRDVGDKREYQVETILTGTPTSTIYLFNLPTGDEIDANDFPGTLSNAVIFGEGIAEEFGVNFYPFKVAFFSTTQVQAFVNRDGTGSAANPITTPSQISSSANNPFIWNTAGDAIRFKFSVPLKSINSPASFLAGATANEKIISQWEDCGPGYSVNWTDATVTSCKNRRVGDEKQYRYRVSITGSTMSGGLTATLPTGDVIDTTKAIAFNSGIDSWGSGQFFDASAIDTYALRVYGNNTTSVFFKYWADLGSNEEMLVFNPVSPVTVAASDAVTFDFKFPIVGLSADAQIVGTFRPAVNASRVEGASGANLNGIGAVEYLGFNSTDFDQDGNFTLGNSGWNGSRTNATIYTVPEDGKYLVVAKFCNDYTGMNDGESVNIYVYKNTSYVSRDFDIYEGGGAGAQRYVTKIISLQNYLKGDQITIGGAQTSGSAATACSDSRDFEFSVHKIDQAGTIKEGDSGPKLASYSLATTTTIDGGSKTLEFDNVDFDYTGGLLKITTGASWEAEALAPIIVEINPHFMISTSQWDVGEEWQTNLRTDTGSGFVNLKKQFWTHQRDTSSVSNFRLFSTGTAQLEMNTGDKFRIEAFQNFGAGGLIIGGNAARDRLELKVYRK